MKIADRFDVPQGIDLLVSTALFYDIIDYKDIYAFDPKMSADSLMEKLKSIAYCSSNVDPDYHSAWLELCKIDNDGIHRKESN